MVWKCLEKVIKFKQRHFDFWHPCEVDLNCRGVHPCDGQFGVYTPPQKSIQRIAWARETRDLVKHLKRALHTVNVAIRDPSLRNPIDAASLSVRKLMDFWAEKNGQHICRSPVSPISPENCLAFFQELVVRSCAAMGVARVW